MARANPEQWAVRKSRLCFVMEPTSADRIVPSVVVVVAVLLPLLQVTVLHVGLHVLCHLTSFLLAAFVFLLAAAVVAQWVLALVLGRFGLAERIRPPVWEMRSEMAGHSTQVSCAFLKRSDSRHSNWEVIDYEWGAQATLRCCDRHVEGCLFVCRHSDCVMMVYLLDRCYRRSTS